MRGAALILLSALLAPQIAAIVCGARCVHVQQHAAPLSAATKGCHDEKPTQGGSTHGSALGSPRLPCHDTSDIVTATVAERSIPHTAPALDRGLRAFFVASGPRAIAISRFSFKRPDIVLIPSRLRI
jgi:hypothetical protein